MCLFRKAARSSSFRLEMTVPFIDTEPADGVSSPALRPSNVVLPLPDGPMMAAVEPFSMWKLTFERTVNSPLPDRYALVNESEVSMAVAFCEYIWKITQFRGWKFQMVSMNPCLQPVAWANEAEFCYVYRIRPISYHQHAPLTSNSAAIIIDKHSFVLEPTRACSNGCTWGEPNRIECS